MPDDTPLTVGTYKAMLRDSTSLRKNGHTWGEYLAKWVTPQNVLLLIMAAVTLGGRVERLETVGRDALEAAKEATQSQAQLLMEIGTLNKTVDKQAATIQAQRDMFATKQNLEALQDRVRLNVTRREFLEFQRSVLPALQRIEHSVKEPR